MTSHLPEDLQGVSAVAEPGQIELRLPMGHFRIYFSVTNSTPSFTTLHLAVGDSTPHSWFDECPNSRFKNARPGCR